MFTVMFALGRLPGWIAHWKEQRADPSPRSAARARSTPAPRADPSCRSTSADALAIAQLAAITRFVLTSGASAGGPEKD
jgi:hypothetical protein